MNPLRLLIISLYFISTVFCAALKSSNATLISLTDDCVSSFNAAILKAHNKYRAKHNTSNLITNITTNSLAQKYAQHLAIENLFQHSGTKNLGENLASYFYSSKPNLDHNNCEAYGNTFAKMWYDEIKNYDFKNPGFSMKTGHFTQVVWKETSDLGCGLAASSLNKVYCVCNYSPPGNYLGEFEENVLPITSDIILN